MAFYIDSADREVVQALWACGVFAGVTTNPSILARSGLAQRDLPELHRWLVDLGVPTIFMQVLGTTREQMWTSAQGLRELGPVVVKVPSTPEGLRVAKDLLQDGCQVLITAVYHPVQAVLARDLGVQWVAPYVGRMGDAGRPGVPGVVAMQQAVGTVPTRIVAASLRSVDQVGELAAAGVPDFTLGAAIAREMVADPLTLAAVSEFEQIAARAADSGR